MQHLDFNCSVPTLRLQKITTRQHYPQKTTKKHNKNKSKQWKLLNISDFKAGTQSIVCVTSFVPPVPLSAVARRSGFFLCGLEPNQNAW